MSANKQQAKCWDYFEIIEVDGVKKTRCQLCKAKLVFIGGSTSSMRAHLKNVHKKTVDGTESGPAKRQTTLTMFHTKKKEMPVFKQNDITKSLALMCAVDLRPVSMVAAAGFKNFCNKLNPSYHIPCRTTVTKHLQHLYDESKKDLIDLIADCPVSLTTDLWTSCSTKSFITLTSHFIDTKWKLRTKLLATRHVEERHSGEKHCQHIAAANGGIQRYKCWSSRHRQCRKHAGCCS